MDQYIRRGPLAKRLDVHPTTIDRWVKMGRLPPPIKLGPGTSGTSAFSVSSVEARIKEIAQEEAEKA